MGIHLVTGGAGFVGSNIVQMLVKRNETVRVLDLYKNDDFPDSVECFVGDINDRELVRRAMSGVDYVHHNVALVPLTKAGGDFWNVNVNGTAVALEEAKKAGVKMFVHMSSSAIFGSPDVMPITNDTERKPVEIYGEAKLAGENLAMEASKNGLPVSIIRPRTIIGTGRLGIFQILFEWIADGSNIYIIGKGDGLFQFVHLDDLCEVSIQCCLQEVSGTFNVGTDEFGTLYDDLSFLCQHANTGMKVRKLPVGLAKLALNILDKLKLSPLAPWHYLTYHKPYYFDSEPVHKQLNWSPKYSNREMLCDTYDWFVKNRELKEEVTSSSIHKKPVKQGILKLLKYISRI